MKALLLGALVVLTLLGAPSPAHAQGTTTSDIASVTLDALPSCLRYRLRGGCLWLRCTIFGCSVRVTVRIEHFQPDVTISTWHDTQTHPWRDYGARVTRSLRGTGNSLLRRVASTATRADSSGTQGPSLQDPDNPEQATGNLIFRGADAIGNPFNTWGYMLGASGAAVEPDDIPVPNPIQLMAFFSSGWSSLAGNLSAVPAEYRGNVSSELAGWRSQAGSLAGHYGAMQSALTGGTGSLNLGPSSGTGGGGSGSGIGSGSGSTVGTGGGFEYACPPGVMPFGLLFHSELDAWFWRGFIPLESLYAASWVPGAREVGQGATQTWGSVFPRQGMVVQQHPVKASAVLAQRVGDIVTRPAQPHIYALLNLTPPGYRYFGFQGIQENNPRQTRWQRVYPNPQRTCEAFGTNDSLSLSEFGNGQNLPDRGHIWNAWRRQECCNAPGGYWYIGSVAI